MPVVMPAVFVFLWSTGFIGAKLGLPYAEPMTFLALRFGIVVALMLPFTLLVRAAWPRNWREASHIAFAGFLARRGLGGLHPWRGLTPALLGLGATVGLVLMAFGMSTTGRSTEDALDADIDALARHVSGLPSMQKGQELLLVGRALQDRADTDRQVHSLLAGEAWLRLGELLDWARTRGVHWTEVGLDGDSITLVGRALAWDTAEALEKKVAEWGFDAELKRQDPGEGNLVPFTVRGVRP